MLRFLHTDNAKQLFTLGKRFARRLLCTARLLRTAVYRVPRQLYRAYRKARRLYRRTVRSAFRSRIGRSIVHTRTGYRVRRFRGILRLLGFPQTIRYNIQRLLGTQITKLKVRGVPTPVFCRPSRSDHRILFHVFGRRALEIPLQDAPRLIVDGGANVGYASIYFANKYPDAQIIAVEPDAENCALFRMNSSAYPNIELIQGGIWPSSADLVIEDSSVRSWSFRLMETSSENNHIKGFTLADILQRSDKQRIDLLKLDIEGSEEQLFSSNYKSWMGQVKNMIIELHGQRCRDVVLAATKEGGFSAFHSGAHVTLKKIEFVG